MAHPIRLSGTAQCSCLAHRLLVQALQPTLRRGTAAATGGGGDGELAARKSPTELEKAGVADDDAANLLHPPFNFIQSFVHRVVEGTETIASNAWRASAMTWLAAASDIF